MKTKPAESRHPVWTPRMIQQRLDRMKRLAAIVGAIERGGIGAGEYHVGADQWRGFERPNRIQREPATSRKFQVAIGRLIPARAEIIRPTDNRAPMLAPVAHHDARLVLVGKIRRPKNRPPPEPGPGDVEIGRAHV